MNTSYDLKLASSRAHNSRFFFILLSAILLILLSAATTATNATTRTVLQGESFQQALDNSSLGDTIILIAGVTYPGPFTLPNKTGGTGTDADYITIQSSALTQLPSSTQRISPSYSPSQMPRLVTGVDVPVISTAPSAHHYRFIGIEFNPTAYLQNIIYLGGDAQAQTSLATVPHHLIFDRCYIHGAVGQDIRRGIALNSKDTTITNCYISGIRSVNFTDAQAIQGWNGPGPFTITNNYLEASGECLGFGGAITMQGLVPSDIEIRRNTLARPPSWRNDNPAWQVKQLLEFKSGQRVIVDGNVMEYNWVGAQGGFAIGLAPRTEEGQLPWIQTRDIQITNNIIRHAGGGINILGKDDNWPSNQVTNITISNNLFDDISGANWGGNGYFMQIANAANIVLDHNTIFHTNAIINAYWAATTGFVMKNNIMAHNTYGIFGDGVGTSTLNHYFPGYQMARNVMAGGNPSNYPSQDTTLPASYYFPASLDDVLFVNRASGNYRLTSSSPFKLRATDGKDVGADLAAIEKATGYTDTATTVPPVAPVKFEVLSDRYISWTDSSNNETGFKIERLISGSYTQIATVGPNTTLYQVPATLCQTDEFRIRATNALGDSAYTYSGPGCFQSTGNMYKINFQPSNAAVPAGYMADFGLPYADRGNGYSYGWDGENGYGARDRNNPVSPDQRYDTSVAMQYSGNRTWELALLNGTYSVHVVAGDADYYDSQHIYKINVEGVLTVNGVPSSTQRWIEGTQTVTVADGKLTVSNAPGSAYNNINFIEITQIGQIYVNFQPSNAAVPTGYMADFGLPYADRGNGYTYGWDGENGYGARDRNNPVSPDQRYDTSVSMQYSGDRTWELALPNGTYSVHVVAGDADYYDSQHIYKINVEGVLIVNGIPSSTQRWIEGTQTVMVTDGKLTVSNAPGSAYNNINFIEIIPN